MSSAIEVSVGRVAITNKASPALNLHEVPLWSVAVSNGFYQKENGPAGTSLKYLDALFYVGKGDAWAESAYLMGKRPDESGAGTARRRGRSVGGGVKEGISMRSCGSIGIGRVEGEYNSAGTDLPGYDDSGAMEGIGSEEEQAVAAVELFKTTQVGLRSDTFPHVLANEVTMRKAEIVDERAGGVQVQLFNTDGTHGGLLWVKVQLADQVFGHVAAVAGKALSTENWPVVGALCMAAPPPPVRDTCARMGGTSSGRHTSCMFFARSERIYFVTHR